MLFLNNKYTSCYYSIINRAQSRSLPEEVYSENHHILPRSLGGNNSTGNLVQLSGREHFICHILLTKMTEGRAKYSMIHAAIGMKRARAYQDRYINSRLYETVRKEFALISSQRNKGKTVTVETRAKMSLASKGRSKSEETKLKMSAAAKGKPKGPMSNEQKLKRSNTLKGCGGHRRGKVGEYKHTLESKAKIAESNRRRVYSQETKDKIAAGVRAANERRKLQK
jgi:hypothetical protein